MGALTARKEKFFLYKSPTAWSALGSEDGHWHSAGVAEVPRKYLALYNQTLSGQRIQFIPRSLSAVISGCASPKEEQ